MTPIPDSILEAINRETDRREAIRRERRERRDRAMAPVYAQNLLRLDNAERRFEEALSHRGMVLPDGARQLLRSCVAGQTSVESFGRQLAQRFPDIYQALFKVRR
jgi:hypothetical protein